MDLTLLEVHLFKAPRKPKLGLWKWFDILIFFTTPHLHAEEIWGNMWAPSLPPRDIKRTHQASLALVPLYISHKIKFFQSYMEMFSKITKIPVQTVIVKCEFVTSETSFSPPLDYQQSCWPPRPALWFYLGVSRQFSIFLFFNFLSRWVGTSPPASPSGDNHMFPKRPIKGHLFLMVLIKASSPSSVTKTWGENVLISCHKLVIEQLLPCRGERRLVLGRVIRFGKNITKTDIHSLCCWKVHLCNKKKFSLKEFILALFHFPQWLFPNKKSTSMGSAGLHSV